MTKDELSRIIKTDIEKNDINNWHGISKDNIEEHLIDPILLEFITGWNSQTKKYWLVLDEKPNEPDKGYQIVYDQEENMFGLATKADLTSKGLGVLFGLYGSFITTLNGM